MTIALFSSLKNEGPFIVEWVAYHRIIGFERIIVASNDCDDGSDLLLSALDDAGVIEHQTNHLTGAMPAQMQAEAKARADRVFAEGDHVMWLDLDEFLVPPESAPSVTALADAMQERGADALSLNWRIMGDSGHTGLPNGFILDQFAGTSKPFFRLSRPVKTLFRFSDAVEQLHLHRPIWKASAAQRIKMIDGCGETLGGEYFTQRFRDGSPLGGVLPRKGFSRFGRVNHYCVRTRLLFALKKARGVGFFGANGAHLARYSDTFFERFNQNVEMNFDILRYRDALIEEHARLMSVPTIAKAHALTVSKTLKAIPTRLHKAA